MLPLSRKSLNSFSITPPFSRSATGLAGSLPETRASTIAQMLGEVLTAIVTPFREDGSVDLEAFRSLCGFLARQRLGRAGGHRHDGRGADAVRRGAAGAVRGRRRRGRRPRDGRRGHRDVLDGPLDPPHGAGARDRRRRVPRRHAVLQQAAAARHRRPRRGDRRGHRQAGGLLRHPVARRGRRRAGDDLAPRGDRERPGREAGEAEHRGGAPRRRVRARPLRGGRRPDPPVPRGRGCRGHLRPHAHRRPEGEGADRELSRGRRRAGPRARRGAPPRDRHPPCADEPDRHQAGAPAPRSRGRRAAASAGGGRRGGDVADPRLPRAARPRRRSLRSDPSVGGFAVELRP